MEQHPVPQNVTTFQFRLIGDMTLKQFGYLAGGAILAYIAYKLPLPFFFTWPLASFFALAGIGFAFVPVEERPMDVWVFSFFKSVYKPTQYVWRRGALLISPRPAPPTTSSPPPPVTLPTPAKTAVPAPVNNSGGPFPKPPGATSATLASIFQSATATATPQIQHPPLFSKFARAAWRALAAFSSPKSHPPHTPAPQSSPVSLPTLPSVTGRRVPPPPSTTRPEQPVPLAAVTTQTKITELEKRLVALQNELAVKAVAEERLLEVQKQLVEVLSEKNEMSQELRSLKKQLAAQPPRPPVPIRSPLVATPPPFPQVPIAPPTPTASKPTVKVLTPDTAVKAGIPHLTSVPNVVTGIIKDTQGNLLTGVLVTIRDQEEVPLRALKTNKLGQFAASTPLPTGTYMVEVEDPRNRFVFDRAQITLTGAVIPALEVIAKSQKELVRQKLAQEIFGKNQI